MNSLIYRDVERLLEKLNRNVGSLICTLGGNADTFYVIDEVSHILGDDDDNIIWQ